MVFALAALTKLFERAGTRNAIRAFGGPVSLSGPLATLLPIAELAVAGALLVPVWTRWGAFGGLALLAVFSTAIARSLRRGEAPDCHCFGALNSEPVGWRTLLRNAVLSAVVIFVIAGGWSSPGPSAVAWVGHLSAAGIVAAAGGLAIALLAGAAAFGFVALLRQNGRLLFRIDQLEQRVDAAGVPGPVPAQPDSHDGGLPLGTTAPTFALEGLHGETLTLESLVAFERPTLLLFTDPGCGPCNALLPQIGAWQREHAATLTFAVLSRGTPDENRAKVSEHGLRNVLLDDDLSAYHAYKLSGTPSAVLIDAEGRVASRAGAGAQGIAAVIAQAVGSPLAVVRSQPNPQPAQPTSPPIGSDAPPVDLPDLTGERFTLAAGDSDTLVLFWNPGCGFCQQMLDDLLSWEANPPTGAPRLVLVSAGSAADNGSQGLRAPILLDPAFSTGSAFGATGTPSGVLVDQRGKIASELAVGAPAVMALAEGRTDSQRNGRGA